MTLTTVYVDNEVVSECVYRLNLILAEHIATTQLATITTAPGKHDALIVDSGCMVVA